MRGFSKIDLIVLIVVILLGILVWMTLMNHGPHGSGHRMMQNSTQIRAIHSGLVLYAQGNNSYFPGVMSDGITIDPAAGLTTQGRMQLLIDQNYFTKEYARSPSEEQTGTTSFAMLKVDVNPDQFTLAKSIRNSEWKDTTNIEAIVLSDRAVPVGGSYQQIQSIHPIGFWDKRKWQGSVGWNDNHVTIESTLNQTTEYGKTNHAVDNLFATSADPDNGDDAFMVFHGTNGI